MAPMGQDVLVPKQMRKRGEASRPGNPFLWRGPVFARPVYFGPGRAETSGGYPSDLLTSERLMAP